MHYVRILWPYVMINTCCSIMLVDNGVGVLECVRDVKLINMYCIRMYVHV